MGTSRLGTVLRLVGIGWFVALCIGGGAFAGLWLDRRLGMEPLFTLLGLFAGLAVAAVGMYRMLLATLASPGKSDGDRKG